MKEISVLLTDDTVKRLHDLNSVINFLDNNGEELSTELLIKVAIYNFLLKHYHYTSFDTKFQFDKISRLGLDFEYPLRHRINEYMESNGVSFATMSTQLDIPKSTLSNILNDKTQLSLETFLRIYAYLGAPPLTDILYRDKPNGKAVQDFE